MARSLGIQYSVLVFCIFILFLFICECVPCMERRASESLELKLQVAVNNPMWLLGPEISPLQEHLPLLTTEPSL